MSFYDHITEFHGLSVVELNTIEDWQGPGFAYRVKEEYDDEVKVTDRLNVIISQPDSTHLQGLIIGAWTNSFEGGSSKEIIEYLLENSSKLPALKHLFMGEMVMEECEISWIVQADQTPLLKAFPQLESFRVRGGSELEFSKTRHANLQELAIETGGLSSNVLRQLFQCEFPQLKRLELLLGDAGYGFDGSIEDLQPLFTGKLYPELKYLGLQNSVISDEIAAVIVNSPLVEQIETLDLSMGTLTDEGANSLLALAKFKNIKALNFSHHFVTDPLLKKLKSVLPFEIIADHQEDPEDEFRGVLHSE